MNQRQTRGEELRDYQDVLAALHTGTYTKQGDIIDWTLWDRFVLNNAVLQHTMFQDGRGSVVAGAARTLADTSVEGSQAIPQGSKLYVRAIVLILQPKAMLTEATYQNHMAMLQETTMNVHVRGKDTQGQWALDEIMAVPIAAALSHSAAGSFVIGASTPKAVGVKLLNLPIILASQVHFSVDIVHHVAPDAAIDDDLVKVGLAGILERLS